MYVLLVEDDQDLAGLLRTGLEETGHTVDLASDGLEGERMAVAHPYEVMILDWGLPGQDGRTLVRRLRTRRVHCPVLMLTAYDDPSYRVAGLDAGADDYLTKPFSFEELCARLRALTRRTGANDFDHSLALGSLQLDSRRRIAYLDGNPITLRPKEFSLLELMLERHDTVVTRTIIAEQVWGTVFGVTDDVINMTMSSLRKTLHTASADTPHPVTIRTLRGIGYLLAVQ